MASALPEVSVVIPAFHSSETIRQCLDALHVQTVGTAEIIVVDSSPDDATIRLIRQYFPTVRCEYSPRRLMPHAARNRGVALSRGSLIAFTDPDVVPAPDWIEQMRNAHRQHRGVIIGSFACQDCGWLDTGIHLYKFSAWLPQGQAGPSAYAPTGNMLIARATFDQLGPLLEAPMIADADYSWRLQEAGVSIHFHPAAVVSHRNDLTLPGFLDLAYRRGREFAALRRAHNRWGAAKILSTLLITILPIRLAGFLARIGRQTLRARTFGSFLRTSPIIAAGHAAWLLGEISVYLRALVRPLSPDS